MLDTFFEVSNFFEIQVVHNGETVDQGVFGIENQDESKWGVGDVDILKVSTSDQIYSDKDKEIVVNVVVKASKEMEEGLIPGITIKTESGQTICGTNSKIIKEKNLHLKKGQTAVIVWTFPNIFNEGQFIIEPAISRPIAGAGRS